MYGAHVTRLIAACSDISVQVAATTLHHRALQVTRAQDTDAHMPGQSAVSDGERSQGQPPSALPAAAADSKAVNGTDKAGKLAARAAELALSREDAELSQKAVSERRGLPSNVEGFK